MATTKLSPSYITRSCDLVGPWVGHNHTVFFDNLYTSPDLCDELLIPKLRSCGTCRISRHDMPPDVKEAKKSLAKGEMRSWQRGQLGCLMWHDSKEVLFLSTHLRVDRITAIPAIGGRPATSRPTVAVDYNFNKGHVDQIDHLRAYYVMERRGRRTWPALARRLLDMCIRNAYKLWYVDNNAKPGLHRFREQLLKQIAAAYPSPHTHV